MAANISVSEHRARFAVESTTQPSAYAAGDFEVLAITVGEGNGWQFEEETLRESLAKWDGVECFIDHAWNGHSLRDLAGVLSGPRWDEQQAGIRATLRALGPSGPLLADLGREMVAGQPAPAPRVGFSADVVFTAQGQRVEKILRVLSVDLVLHPARGGAFLRSVNSEEKAVNAEQLSVNNEEKGVEMTGEELKAVREQMCAALLESELAAAKLPGPVSEQVRRQFAGKAFGPGELNQAIADARKMVAELTGPAAIAGVPGGNGRVQGMFSSEDQFSAALHDLLGVERPEGLGGLRAAKLSGIRELYTRMTGDVDFNGGYDPARAQFSATTDLPGLLKNAMNKLVLREWQELGRSGYAWWEPVVSVEHFTNLHQITGVLVGEVTVLPGVNEGAAYQPLAVSDSAEVGSWAKYGGYIGLTLEMFERDETHRLRQYPRRLASAGLRRISALVGSVFTDASGVGPTMADSKAVFHADHDNLGTTALSAAAWEAASAAIYNQAMLVGEGGTAPKLALDAKYLVVPRGLRLTARQILYPSWEREASIVSENMQRGEAGDVITCPEFSDANDWAAVADPRLAPGIIVGERFGLLPEIVLADNQANGALFTNDEIRLKARHWLAVFVADYRGLYKANVG